MLQSRQFIRLLSVLLGPIVAWHVTAGAALAQTCLPSPPGLVSWWPGDGNASDIADNNPGQLVGATFVPGVVDQAFSLGGNAFVQVVDSPNLDVGTGDFTVEFWMRTTQVAVGMPKTIVGKYRWAAPASSQVGFDVG